jgi:hypothetical protein
MHTPLVSLVIPTRNRLAYLKAALQSAFDQNDDGLEIIVPDNATDDGTREYLVSLGDRIKYTRSDVVLSMTDNWYRGLDMATGEWIIFIGDDDCIMPDFMASIRTLVPQVPHIEMITWDCAIYRWPGAAADENMFQFRVSGQAVSYQSAEILRSVFENIANIIAPAGLYHSITKRSVIQRIKNAWGEYRLGRVPDLGSGLLHLAFTDKYMHYPFPLTIMGFSKQSTGMSCKVGGKHRGPADEFRRLSRFSELEAYLPEMRDSESADVGQWRLLLEWRDYFSSKGRIFTFNSKKMLEYCVAHLYAVPAEMREKAAANLVDYAPKVGANQRELRAMAQSYMNFQGLLSPGIDRSQENSTRICMDLGQTPIQSIGGAAALLRGLFVRR